MMKRNRIVQAVLGLVFFSICAGAAQAAEIKILCSTALRGVSEKSARSSKRRPEIHSLSRTGRLSS